MPDASNLLSQFYLTVGGVDASEELVRAVQSTMVQNSLHMPDVATLVIDDPRMKWVDDAQLAPGATLEIMAKTTARNSRAAMIFDGEIVEMEPQFGSSTQHLVIRAFDRLHRLARGSQARSFQNVTDADVAKTMAGEVKLETDCADVASSQVYPYLFQNNESNLDFLRRRAANVGCLLYVRGKTLCFKPPQMDGQAVELKWGESLTEFRPRLTTLGQVNSVIVRGWDVGARKAISAQNQKGRGAPEISQNPKAGDVAKKAFHIEASHLVANQPIRTQASADHLAQAVADRHVERFVQAEGMCGGNPAIVAGASIKISNLGQRFSGTYFVTSSTHIYDGQQGFVTQFSVSGQTPDSLLSILRPDIGEEQPRTVPHTAGLAIAVVTDNNDPDGMGRVKVMYPWLSADHASDWVRVAAPGGGPQRGIEFLPEVDDEVLVGFEMGDIHYPYVIGGLWNGKDAPPKKSSALVSSGKVTQRIIRSRTGHEIVLDDSDGGGGITIRDKKGNSIAIDSSNGNMTVKVSGDLSLKADGKLSLEAGAKLSIKGMGIEIDGGSATVDVKGSMINLN